MSCEGVVQGDPMASLAFALSMQSTYAACVEGSKITALAIQDDLYLCGDAGEVLTALGKLEQLTSVMELQLCREKCQVLPCSASASASTLEFITDSCREAGVGVVTRLQALGCPLSSSDSAVQSWCETGVERMTGLLRPARAPRRCLRRSAYSLLRQCAQPTMSYLARVVPSEQLQSAARAFDGAVVDLVCAYAFRRWQCRHGRCEGGTALATRYGRHGRAIATSDIACSPTLHRY